MAKVGINTGSAANAGDGSALRAGANIINANFNEVYEYLGDGTTLDADLGGKWSSVSTGINTLSNIGIGTTNPWNALTVLGNASITGVTTSSGGFSGDITGTVTGNVYNTGISTFQDVLVSGASTVTGKSTFTGIGTFSSDLYVGGNLYTLGDITYDEVNGRNISVTGIGTVAYLGVTDINVSGFSTFSGLSTTGSDLYIGDSLYVSQDATVTGVVTATTFAGNLTGTPTLGTGVTVYSSGIVSATTFVGDLTGNPTGSAAGLTAVPGGQLTGTLAAVNGSSLSGIVTSISAGNNISVSGATGAITITGTGAGSTEYIDAASLTVSGIATVGTSITMRDGAINVTGIVTATGLDAAISVWTLAADGTSHYTFTGPGNLSGTNDPTLSLIRGQKYVFQNRSGGHPFRIQSTVNGSAGTAYNTGVTNNDAANGTDLIFDVPYDAPPVLYYQCTAHANMGGAIYIGSSSSEDVQVGAALTVTGALTASGGVVGDLTGASTQVTIADESSDTTCFVIFTTGATGNLAPKSGTNLTFNSANGTLTASYFSGDGSNLTNIPATVKVRAASYALGSVFAHVPYHLQMNGANGAVTFNVV